MNDASIEAALQIARLPDLAPELLTLIEGALLLVGSRDGTVSMQSVQTEIGDRLKVERLETVFFALAQVGVLTRQRRDQRGYAFDLYHVDPCRLRQIMHDVTLIGHVLAHIQAEERQTGQIKLVATLPDSLPLSPEIRQTIPSLAAALHRLIVEAEEEIVVLNPFFEPAGFKLLETALLEAARRGVAVIIVSSMLTEPSSVNYRVIQQLVRQTLTAALTDHFRFYEYGHREDNTVAPLHAKVIMSDRKIAYVGSANLTEYGLTHNLEIGILSEGPHLLHLQNVVDAILESSTDVSAWLKHSQDSRWNQ